jgi:methyl-accepting chemotaxis protein
MTDEELRSLVANLAVATARNTEAIDRTNVLADRNAEAIDRISVNLDRTSTLADRNAEAIDRISANLDRTSALADRNAEAIDRISANLDRTSTLADRNAEAISSLGASIEFQAQSIENMRENMSYNTQTVADGLKLAAAANQTAAAVMEMSANTSRNLDRLERDIADLKQIVGIVIRDNQADRSRISRLEDTE